MKQVTVADFDPNLEQKNLPENTTFPKTVASTMQSLVFLSQQTETTELTQIAAHNEVEHLRKLFNDVLGYKNLNWLERKLIKEDRYNEGIKLFFSHLHADIDQKKIRSYDQAVEDATKAIAKDPSKGEQLKASMHTKIREKIPSFETRYKSLRQQINNLE